MNNFDITTLETALKSVIKTAGVSSTVFNNRPKANVSADDFVVVRVAGEIDDYGCYGTCQVEISLFARDNSNIKNGAKLSKMYQTLIANLPQTYDVTTSGAVTASFSFDSMPTIDGDIADDYGYHARMLSVETTIKSI